MNIYRWRQLWFKAWTKRIKIIRITKNNILFQSKKENCHFWFEVMTEHCEICHKLMHQQVVDLCQANENHLVCDKYAIRQYNLMMEKKRKGVL